MLIHLTNVFNYFSRLKIEKKEEVSTEAEAWPCDE